VNATDTDSRLAEIKRILSAAAPPSAAMQARGAGMNSLGGFAHKVLLASFGPTWDRPSLAERDLEELRVTVRLLRRQLADLPGSIRTALNQEGDDDYRRIRELNSMTDFDEASMAELQSLLDKPTPQDQWTTPAMERELARLEAACVLATERTIRAGQSFEPSGSRGGRPPNWRARQVAFAVAHYLTEANGEPPALWTGQSPKGPFATALVEIFHLLGIKADIRRAGEWALSKLSETD